ncbi:MAG: DUF5053 domain-containing protein [Prevotella sp.]|uniref:DUF5053 domain-containing protein n=1 Tax=Prevotella sp. TaxID=59823 RepID=UPI002A314163|nr:DUF5053 domain-containing protein [Prevotella sp.]MDD7317239.1 DUF5053 domain-containing protein [Prevotellaceae bacterium]MDY4019843.1 DUF5053 domain-containing protein [Prevotella sp.]
MKEVEVKLKELRMLMQKDDEQSEARRNEIAQWLKENRTPEVEEAFRSFMDEGLAEIEVEVEDIRRQISDEDYRILPLAYIAKNYFGKSHAWLSQRINGTKVRGKVYTLNEEQKEIFNAAMKDLARKFGSFHIA